MQVVLLILGIILLTPTLSKLIEKQHLLAVRSLESSEIYQKVQIHSGTYNIPQIYEMDIISKISNRFAHTTVLSKIENFKKVSIESIFYIIVPDSAFISGFIMESNGTNYTAEVKEAGEARYTYRSAVLSGLSAAHVSLDIRDSNSFILSLNVEPQGKAAFFLMYEQFLHRQDGYYEHIINIYPGQPVTDLNVEVSVSESRKIVYLKVPQLRSGNEIGSDNFELDPRPDIVIINDTNAIIKFKASIERQKQLARAFNATEDNGLAGQFVVQYDVERDLFGEVLVQNGYFVHFFAPSNLKPIPKHVVFILDTSGSMLCQKLVQLKEAMQKILDELRENDLFSLVEFNSDVKVWNINNVSASVSFPVLNRGHGVPLSLENIMFPRAYPVNEDTIKKAKHTVEQLVATGSSDMQSGLQVGLHLVEVEVKDINNIKRQPMIIFLTDGFPNQNPLELLIEISEFNTGARKSPIFGLSFGSDNEFIKRLSSCNYGFSKYIYEAVDASVQLQNFYRQISSPLLSNIRFKYEPSVTNVTETEFPLYFGGSELVVAGLYENAIPNPTIDGCNSTGNVSFKSTVANPNYDIERLWAYLTVSQLLNGKATSETEKELLEKKALDLALRYSFVTSVSSYVVIKPNKTDEVQRQRVLNLPFFSKANRRGRARNRLKSVQLGDVNVPLAPTSISSSLDLNTLSNLLPWLKNIIDDKAFVKVPAAGTYTLGLNETTSHKVPCINVIDDREGYCCLLHECPNRQLILRTVDDFYNRLCLLQDKFAGVCCPN